MRNTNYKMEGIYTIETESFRAIVQEYHVFVFIKNTEIIFNCMTRSENENRFTHKLKLSEVIDEIVNYYLENKRVSGCPKPEGMLVNLFEDKTYTLFY